MRLVLRERLNQRLVHALDTAVITKSIQRYGEQQMVDLSTR
jgi:hypothetical protein